MAGHARIHTPLAQRWRRFRYQVLPVLAFVVCIAITMLLWDRQARLGNAVGTVDGVRVPVTAGIAGTLLSLDHLSSENDYYWATFDQVNEGEVIARLDDSAARAELATLNTELARLRSQIEAEQARLRLDHIRREQDRSQELMRLTWRMETLDLDIADRLSQILADMVERDRLNTQLGFLQPLAEDRQISQLQLQDLLLRRDRILKQIEKNIVAVKEARSQKQRAEERIKTYPRSLVEAVEKLIGPVLEPVRRQIDVQESVIKELHVRIKSLEVRAPISGTIASIEKYPTHNVLAGDVILTIASNQGRHIVSYLREQQRIRPRLGMAVKVRMRQPGSRPLDALVDRIGAGVEPVPIDQLNDPNMPEFGLPVRITKPDAMMLRPGEKVDILFPHASGGDPG